MTGDMRVRARGKRVGVWFRPSDPLARELGVVFDEGVFHEANMIVKINEVKDNLPGKLAEVELHFNDGVLEGLKLIGFTVWDSRTGGRRNVTFPARTYSVNGERRSFALLRPAAGDATAQDRVRELILEAYAEYESSGKETKQA